MRIIEGIKILYDAITQPAYREFEKYRKQVKQSKLVDNEVRQRVNELGNSVMSIHSYHALEDMVRKEVYLR